MISLWWWLYFSTVSPSLAPAQHETWGAIDDGTWGTASFDWGNPGNYITITPSEQWIHQYDLGLPGLRWPCDALQALDFSVYRHVYCKDAVGNDIEMTVTRVTPPSQ